MLLPLGQTESDLICYVLQWVDSTERSMPSRWVSCATLCFSNHTHS